MPAIHIQLKKKKIGDLQMSHTELKYPEGISKAKRMMSGATKKQTWYWNDLRLNELQIKVLLIVGLKFLQDQRNKLFNISANKEWFYVYKFESTM